MNFSKVSILASEFLGKVLRIAGYFISGLFGIGVIAAIFSVEPNLSTKFSQALVFGILMAIGLFVLSKGKKIKRYIERFRMYIAIISEGISSIDEIASLTDQSYDFVEKDLQSMIDKKYFANAYIDTYSNRIIVILPEGAMHFSQENEDETSVEAEVVNCRGCGAANVIPKGGVGICEYCGAPISK